MDERDTTAPLDVAEMQAGWAAREPRQPAIHAGVRAGARTDVGRVRENNEDKYEVYEPDEPDVLARRGRLYAVADGMGGHAAGQIASEVALKTFVRVYYGDPGEEPLEALARAAHAANRYVLDVARTTNARGGMGTTLTAAAIREDDLLVLHVGDSRLYRLRDRALQLLTDDHTLVGEAVRDGRLTPEQAAVHPQRNVITRSIGAEETLEPETFAVKIEVGDRFLLCSDGLSTMLSDAEIADTLAAGSPSVAAWALVDRACASGGHDNVTALVLHVEGVDVYVE